MTLIVRVVNNRLDFYFISILILVLVFLSSLFLDLGEGYNVMLHMTVIYITKYDRSVIYVIRWSYMLWSLVT